jgi:hypothetical protein
VTGLGRMVERGIALIAGWVDSEEMWSTVLPMSKRAFAFECWVSIWGFPPTTMCAAVYLSLSTVWCVYDPRVCM